MAQAFRDNERGKDIVFHFHVSFNQKNRSQWNEILLLISGIWLVQFDKTILQVRHQLFSHWSYKSAESVGNELVKLFHIRKVTG